MNVALSRLHFPIKTLGPGRRVGLWLQGCSIGCPGCISRDTWDAGKGNVPLADVLQGLSAVAGQAEGLTVSGGEPFDQPEALAAILTHWRSISSSSILLFTGYEWSDVVPWFEVNADLVDAIMTGPFRSYLPQTLALRGSDNQTLHILSALGEAIAVYDRPAELADRKLDVMFDEAGDAWFAGIPARGDLALIRRTLLRAGHRATTSDSVRA